MAIVTSSANVQPVGRDGSRIVSTHTGPHVVRVHEASHVSSVHTASRFFLSVDLKCRELDGIRSDYWFGMGKTEAIRKATALAGALAVAVKAVEAAQSSTLRGKEILVARQQARLASMLAPYSI